MKADYESLTHAEGRSQLISHGADSHNGWEDALQRTKSRLQETGDLPGATVDQQINLLEELSTFELGRFLLVNRGLNAYWTHRLVTYRRDASLLVSPADLQHQVFEKLPTVLATRERFGIFRQELQGLLDRPGLVLASVPCGLMGELLLLDHEQQADVTLVGIDLDEHALAAAHSLAQERGLGDRLSLRCEDAWSSGSTEEFDVLTSNGLNIYEPDDDRVTALYRSFFKALTPGGRLVTSFLTPPPALSEASPWNMAEVDPVSLALQNLLFVRLVEARWSAFRTHAQTRAQLEEAGFVDVRFVDDRARMFPTVVARKPA